MKLLKKNQAIPPPSTTETEDDTCIWGGSTNGVFAISIVIERISTAYIADMEKKWKAIWKLNVSERIMMFIWMINQNGLKTNQYLNNLKLRDSLCDDYDG